MDHKDSETKRYMVRNKAVPMIVCIRQHTNNKFSNNKLSTKMSLKE